MGKVTPFDLLRPSVPRVDHDMVLERMSVCEDCPELHFKVCGVCKCFMPAKTTLAAAECPLGKWGPVE